MKEILLSIIIPVYNVELYIEECFSSIEKQVDELCEVIFVDDGSTDRCSEICDKYSKLRRNIKVIHKNNEGLGSARNVGLNIASGKYVIFLDSDDRIAQGAIGQILKWANISKADICFMQAIKFFPDGTCIDLGDGIKSVDFPKSKIEILEYLSRKNKFPGSACTKVFRREFLKTNSILFPEKKRISEDLPFVLKAIYKAKQYDVLDCDFYEYRQNRKGSITNSFSKKSYEGLRNFVLDSCILLCEENRPKGYEEQLLMAYVAYEYCILVYNVNLIGDYREEVLIFLREYKWVLKYAVNIKIVAVRFIINLFGFEMTSYILNKVKRR